MSRDYTEITDEQLRTINKRAVEQPSYEQLREQNRVLREALQEISTAVWEPGLEGVYDEDARYNYPDREQNIRRMAQAVLTATSQEGQG